MNGFIDSKERNRKNAIHCNVLFKKNYFIHMGINMQVFMWQLFACRTIKVAGLVEERFGFSNYISSIPEKSWHGVKILNLINVCYKWFFSYLQPYTLKKCQILMLKTKFFFKIAFLVWVDWSKFFTWNWVYVSNL